VSNFASQSNPNRYHPPGIGVFLEVELLSAEVVRVVNCAAGDPVQGRRRAVSRPQLRSR
jgi:hypothetical protein